MSSRQLEEQAEARRDAWLAKLLGVQVEDLRELDLTMEEITGNDGAFYGYRAIVGPEANKEIVAQKLNHSRVHQLGFMPDDEEE